MAIKKLPQDVINQIAAGEVVERPAHLVKELVENSLDAGATEVEVVYAQGGRFVSVQDNGSGMDAEDLKMALEPHATSKIHASKDLWALNSFGFRGEALASIASVSRLTLLSKQGEKPAYQIYSEFGQKSEVMEAGGVPGTKVVVKDLFENVPARLKFLKTEAAEGTLIKNTLKALALSHIHVTFRVRSRDKLLFYWPGVQQLKERVEQVLDQKPLYEVQFEKEGLRLEAVVSSPQHTFKNSKQMWFFAQNRWIQDKTFMAATLEAYRSLLMHGEYPLAVIKVWAPQEDIDVNVHPTKSLVKFRKPSLVFQLIQQGIRQLLEQAPWVVDLFSQASEGEPSSETVFPKEAGAEVALEVEQLNQERELSPTENLSFQGVAFQQVNLPKKDSHFFKREKAFQPEESRGSVVASLKKAAFHPPQETSASSGVPQELRHFWSNLHIIGQSHLTYVVAQTDKSILFIDQHAAHERVLFESLMEQWRQGKFEVQPFLFPLTLDLGEDQVEALLSYEKEWLKMGVELEQSGPSTVSVRTAPAIVEENALGAALETFSQDIQEKGGSFAFEKAVSHVFATMACHSAIRAGQALSFEEIKSLLQQMDQYPLSTFCPHGRPVYVEYTIQKLERDFGRIV
ncbi:MAG: DNA mismatch repair endonuclease MutL [Bdellovibrio sp.]|nr:MAG: DNA mismatch repair endonuclease MutL [Bdellovibrio sp.]